MDAEMVFTRVRRQVEKVRDYFSAMQKLAKRIPSIDDDLLRGILVRGLLPQIKCIHVTEVRQLSKWVDKMTIAAEARRVTFASNLPSQHRLPTTS